MEQPSVKFTKASGVQVKAKMQMSVEASGTLIKKTLFDAQVDMDIGVNLRIDNNYVKGTCPDSISDVIWSWSLHPFSRQSRTEIYKNQTQQNRPEWQVG